MKRRDEDRIIDLAFGEIPDSEAGRLQEQYNSNPAAAQTLSQFKRLKADLPLLNDIPDHQISTERLREAILRGGLKQKRNYWAWSLVPALAAAASLFFLLPRNPSAQTVSRVQTPAPETTVAFETLPSQESAFHPETELTNLNHAVRSTYSYGSDNNGDDAKPALKQPEKRKREYVPAELNSSMVALNSAGQAGDAVIPQTEAAPANQPASQAPTDLTAAPPADDTSAAAMNDPQKIIVVHDAEDNSTGAQQATEVDPTSNVVVGG
ncbi:MAG TPA: hypothetical protein VGL56_15070 [Fimbriimonadaceae bacterium]|jgi:hypothetical protein